MDAVGPKPKVPRPKSSGVVVPHRARWHQRLGAALVYGFIRCVAATVRFRMEDGSGLFRGAPPGRIIFSIWHNRLALSLIMYRRYVVRFAPERRLAAMVSASRDGGLLARILEHFCVEPVRGSSSRRGPQALREMLSWAERGHDLAITPDGPRGPCYKVQEGVISTAQLTGLPIVPVSYHLNWKYRPRSWDRFQVPLPFARCTIRTGELLRVPRDAGEAEREALRQQLERIMAAITRD
ncbi:MAG TPA: lysophospholipid acyltransferase family protein [Candidatus Angelobacter sp.]|nr:lysophospholipid acyltransferase family protein [Candidatus Angelobacter sp.]